VKTIKLVRLDYKGSDRLFLEFRYDAELIALTKTIEGAAWSQSRKCWHIPFAQGTTEALEQLFSGKAVIENTLAEIPKKTTHEISEKNNVPGKNEPGEVTEATGMKLKQFTEWLRSRRYSESTVKTYTESISTFLRYYSAKPAEEITNDDLVYFNNHYILANRYSSSFQNQIVYPVGFKK